MTEKQQQNKENRQRLIEISQVAKQLLQTGEFSTVNEAILNGIYKEQHPDIETFKTYNQWKNEGRQVIKGSKGFVVWGKPKKAQEENPNTDEKEAYKYWPMCYLFSNLQTEPMPPK